MAHDAAAERHALLLAARQLARLAAEQLRDPQHRRGALDFLADARLPSPRRECATKSNLPSNVIPPMDSSMLKI